MAAFRSWIGALLSLAVFLVGRHFARGLALPTCIATIIACVYIWTIVLRVPAALKGMELVAEEPEEASPAAAATEEHAEAAKPGKPRESSAEAKEGAQDETPEPRPEAREGAQEETPETRPEAREGSQEKTLETRPEAREGSQEKTLETRPEAREGVQEETPEMRPEESKAGGLWDDSDSEDQDGVVVEEEFVDPERAKELKLEGNEHFKAGRLHDAREAYSEAIHLSPQTADKEKAVLFANRAACHQKFGGWEEVVNDCTKAVQFDPEYTKAYMRRSTAYEEQSKFHDACEDLKKAIELDPSIKSREYRRLAVLEKRAAEQFEKDKDEMVGKLKDLGNMVLGKFGMSCDNFKMEQDPETGSYSIKYQN